MNHTTGDLTRALTKSLASSCAVINAGAGFLVVTGNDRLDLLHRISTNALLGMKPGQATLTVFTNEKARIIDVALVLVRQDEILLVCSAGRHESLKTWIEKFIIMDDVRLEDRTPAYRLITVYGPDAGSSAAAMTGPALTPGAFLEGSGSWAGVTVALTQHPQALQASILLNADDLPAVIAGLSTQMQVFSGEEAECARIAFGVPSPGHELSESFTPYDAGLRHAISFTKGCYIGQEVIARLDTYQKIRRGLSGVILQRAPELRTLPVSLFRAGQEAGVLTSMAKLGRGAIGLAVVRTDHMPSARLACEESPDAPVVAQLAPLPLTPSDFQMLEHA